MPSLAFVAVKQTKISMAKFYCEAASAAIFSCKTGICFVLVQIRAVSAMAGRDFSGYWTVSSLSLNLGEFVSH